MPTFRQIQLPGYQCHHHGLAFGNLNHNLNLHVDHFYDLLITRLLSTVKVKPFLLRLRTSFSIYLSSLPPPYDMLYLISC